MAATSKLVTKRRARWWRHVRAAFVVFHVLAVLLLSLPSSRKLSDRARWKNQRTQREFALWAQRLKGWGVDTDAARFEKRLWSVSQQYLGLQRIVVIPFQSYDRLGGMVQGWGMFRSPQRRPAVLRVEVFEAHRWHTVYLSRSPEHTYLATQLDHNRIRKLVGRSGRNGRIFEELARWIVSKAATDFPHARKARVTLERFESLPREARHMGHKRKLVLQRRHGVDLEPLR